MLSTTTSNNVIKIQLLKKESYLKGSRLIPTYLLPTFHLFVCTHLQSILTKSHLHLYFSYYHLRPYGLEYSLHFNDEKTTSRRLLVKQSSHQVVELGLEHNTSHSFSLNSSHTSSSQRILLSCNQSVSQEASRGNAFWAQTPAVKPEIQSYTTVAPVTLRQSQPSDPRQLLPRNKRRREMLSLSAC